MTRETAAARQDGDAYQHRQWRTRLIARVVTGSVLIVAATAVLIDVNAVALTCVGGLAGAAIGWIVGGGLRD